MTLPDRDFELLTFDCYGTLIDWEAGILSALRPIADKHGVGGTDEELLGHFAETEHIVQEGPFAKYREVLSRTMDALGERLGFEPSAEDRAALAESIANWPPFDDTIAALHQLAARYKLAIVSNIDDDLFEGSAKQLKTDFDWVITAAQVGSYKPATGHFEEMLARTGIPKERVLHVAQSLFHDIEPAKRLGFTTVWVNRRAGREGSGATPPSSATPDLEVPDLQTLATLIA